MPPDMRRSEEEIRQAIEWLNKPEEEQWAADANEPADLPVIENTRAFVAALKWALQEF